MREASPAVDTSSPDARPTGARLVERVRTRMDGDDLFARPGAPATPAEPSAGGATASTEGAADATPEPAALPPPSPTPSTSTAATEAEAAAPPPGASTPEPAKEREPESRGMAALLRHERRLHEQQRALRAEREAFEAQQRSTGAELAALREKIAGVEAARAKAQIDPLAYLEDAGLTPEQILEAKLKGEPSAMAVHRTVSDELKRQQTEIEAAKKAAEDARAALEEAKLDAQIRDFKRDIAVHVREHAGDYPTLIDEHGAEAQDAVYAFMTAWFERTREPIRPERAAAMLEDHLVSEHTARLARLKANAKFAKLFVAGGAPTGAVPATPKAASGARTLTNARVSAPSTGRRPSALHDEEDMEAAEEMIRRARRTS